MTELRSVQEQNKEVVFSIDSQAVNHQLEAYSTGDIIVKVDVDISHFTQPTTVTTLQLVDSLQIRTVLVPLVYEEYVVKKELI